MSSGGVNWPVPDARALPPINMMTKSYRGHGVYVETTLDAVFDETAKVASCLRTADEKLDILTKGADRNGFKNVQHRFTALGAAASSLDKINKKRSNRLRIWIRRCKLSVWLLLP